MELTEANEGNSAPFPLSTVKSIAKKALGSKENKRGITDKAVKLLSFAAGEILVRLAKDAVEDVNNQKQAKQDKFNKKSELKSISKSQLVEVCLKHERYRFAVSFLKMDDLHQYFDQPSELSKRLALSITNYNFTPNISFVAPNPPGRQSTRGDETDYREVENTNSIISALSMSLSAYMHQVPEFLKNP